MCIRDSPVGSLIRPVAKVPPRLHRRMRREGRRAHSGRGALRIIGRRERQKDGVAFAQGPVWIDDDLVVIRQPRRQGSAVQPQIERERCLLYTSYLTQREGINAKALRRKERFFFASLAIFA